jgi:prepilin-type N-terminal cleavage/methylation domain-containing protein
MPTDRAPVPTRPAPRRKLRRAAGDDGFSLLEVLVALAVIGTVMAGAAPFLVKSVAVVAQQRTRQVAVEVANNALERARALSPTSLLAGRGLTAVQNQLAGAPDQVKSIVTGLTALDADASLTSVTDLLSGATAALPTAAVPVTVGGVTYQQNWYVKSCWQSKADSALPSAGLTDCLETKPLPGLVAVPYFRVVVAVTWEQNVCPGDQCVYVASTLVSTNADPVFDLKRPPPTIVSPGQQAGYVDESVNFQVVAAGGTLPRTWTLTGLPPGLTATTAGVITGKPTTAGTYTVTANVQDRELQSDDATFSWVVADLPVLTSPGPQVFRTLTLTSLPVTLTGGLRPAAWTATGLPNGLAINPLTGIITGTALATQATPQTATVKVVDSTGKKTVSTTFTWRVFTPVVLMSPGTQNATRGNVVNYTLGQAVTGGQQPYLWSATGLPPGLAIDTGTGTVTGTITGGTRFLVSVTVTDNLGGTASIVVPVNIAAVGTDLRVTAPSPANPDRTTAVNATVSLTATASNGTSSGYTWSATDLPPGLVISSSGQVTGKPTTAGKYITTLTVRDSASNVATLMLNWTVTA